MSRTARVERRTAETNICAALSLDGKGQSAIQTGIGFFDHMLTLWAKHGLFDLQLTAEGDLYIDGHHTVEDTGIVLGKALAEAVGDKAGIRRYGTAFVPMDEALVQVSLDLSGRSFLHYEVNTRAERIGNFDTELVEEFLRAFADNAGLTLHVMLQHGKNGHHIMEAVFKALGRALDEATRKDERIVGVLSTKGSL